MQENLEKGIHAELNPGVEEVNCRHSVIIFGFFDHLMLSDSSKDFWNVCICSIRAAGLMIINDFTSARCRC